jgi:hypothetical protein
MLGEADDRPSELMRSARSDCKQRIGDTIGKWQQERSSAPASEDYLRWVAFVARERRLFAVRKPSEGEVMMTKIALAVALAIAAMSTIPAFASPTHDMQVACKEDLGYGRTGSYGC